jgi:hypothetical protein
LEARTHAGETRERYGVVGSGFFRSPPDVQFVRSSGSDSHAERLVAEAFGSAPLILAGSGVARELLKGP